MNILIDTNVFIQFEDYKIIDNSINELHKLSNLYNFNIFIHPASKEDVNQDKDIKRRNITLSKMQKYSILEKAPSPSDEELAEYDLFHNKSNDKIDNTILYALIKNTVNILITQDIRLIKKAKRLQLESRVMFVQQALTIFKQLHQVHQVTYPQMFDKYVYELDKDDKIFDSLKKDYKEFKEWFQEICAEHRKCWIHSYNNTNIIGGLLIYKHENNPIVNSNDRALRGQCLKISTFKIAEDMQGMKLGELFIKKVFHYAKDNNYDYVYITAQKDKQEYLVNILEDFGFYHFGKCSKDRDDVYVKIIPTEYIKDTTLSKLDYHKKYSPFTYCDNTVNKYIIPIIPDYHNILFPELEDEDRLFYTNPSAGNTIKKAYLSHSNTSTVKEGDLILFYRSKDNQAITTFGIVERAQITDNLDEIIEMVAKRTVFSYRQIKEMSKKKTNIILFRLIGHFDKPFITKEWLEKEEEYKTCQSICKIEDKLFKKIITRSNINYCV